MQVRLSPAQTIAPELVATATLTVDTSGEGFSEITGEVSRFLVEIGAGDGALFAYLRHTSASLVIQENADAGWVHDTEGPDDMPAHVKTMLTGVSLHVPVTAGRLGLGTWQGLYLAEHRTRPHRREVMLQFVGSRRPRG